MSESGSGLVLWEVNVRSPLSERELIEYEVDTTVSLHGGHQFARTVRHAATIPS